MSRSISFLLFVLVIASSVASGQGTHVDSLWRGWQPLMGEWVGGGGGTPGQGEGGFSFTTDLQGTVLIRKNYASYPATPERPAFRHDDLMIVAHENGRTIADYFDNEGHVIRYAVSFSPDSNEVVFVSDIAPAQPRFKLTYVKEKEGEVKILFDIAPPGKPEAFSRYIEATAIRRGR